MQDPRIGQDFGDYIVKHKLAEGGMGAVYLAEHPSGMRKVVKFMHAECLKVEAVRKRFETECMAAKRLKGRAGIVDIDSFGWRNGEMYLVMEHLDGVTLEAHIKQNGRLTEHHTYHVMLLILRALSALHGEGIVHRDLKPSNVFLRDTDERQWDPKLIDFGIVHDKHANTGEEFRTRENQMIGTVGYMATEQYGRANTVTPATDVFACAVMIWEMLTGHLPWGLAETEFAQYDRQLNHAPMWPAHVQLLHAPGWKQLLVEVLAPDPDRRPASAQLFALLLAQHLEPIPPHVPSGLDMVARLVPKFLQNLPAQVETVRQPNGQISVARFWSPSTPASPMFTPSGSGDFAAIRVSAAMPAAHVSAPTISARPSGPSFSTPGATPAPVSPMTTLSAASGIASRVPGAPSSRARLAGIGIATAIAIGGITFAVTQLRGRTEGRSDGSEAPTARSPQPTTASSLPPSPPPTVVNAPAPPDAGLAPSGIVDAGTTAEIRGEVADTKDKPVPNVGSRDIGGKRITRGSTASRAASRQGQASGAAGSSAARATVLDPDGAAE